MNIKYAYSLALLLSLTSGYSCGMEKEKTVIPNNWLTMSEKEQEEYIKANTNKVEDIKSLFTKVAIEDKAKPAPVNIALKFELGDKKGRLEDIKKEVDPLNQDPKTPWIGYMGQVVGFAATLALAQTPLAEKVFKFMRLSTQEGTALTTMLGIAAGGSLTVKKSEQEYYRNLFWRTIAGFAIIEAVHTDFIIKLAQRVPVYGTWIEQFGSSEKVKSFISIGIWTAMLSRVTQFERYGSYHIHKILNKAPLFGKYFELRPFPGNRKQVTFTCDEAGAATLSKALETGDPVNITLSQGIPNPDAAN